jgi:hypothetical protein
MNARELADEMYNGAELKKRWKTRQFNGQNKKQVYALLYSDGRRVVIQKSTVDGALHRKMITVTSIWSGGNMDYGITDHWRMLSDAIHGKPGHLPLGLLLAQM